MIGVTLADKDNNQLNTKREGNLGQCGNYKWRQICNECKLQHITTVPGYSLNSILCIYIILAMFSLSLVSFRIKTGEATKSWLTFGMSQSLSMSVFLKMCENRIRLYFNTFSASISFAAKSNFRRQAAFVYSRKNWGIWSRFVCQFGWNVKRWKMQIKCLYFCYISLSCRADLFVNLDLVGRRRGDQNQWVGKVLDKIFVQKRKTLENRPFSEKAPSYTFAWKSMSGRQKKKKTK